MSVATQTVAEQREESRRQKWKAMAQQGIPAFLAEKPEVFRRRARGGVPMEHRWQAWKAAMRVDSRAEPGKYQQLLQVDNEWTRLIEIDTPRTFPDIPLFDKEHQFSLLRVLKAFANLEPAVGYCQGMNFVAGLLLFVAQNGDFRESPRLEKEEEAFWMLTRLMTDGRLSGFYRRHFPLLRRYLWAFDQLAAKHLPELKAHFAKEGVQHGVYLHQWFLTLFINCVPMEMVLVFWDAIICGGRGLEIMLPLTVALLQAVQDQLLSLPFEDIVRFFKVIRTGDGAHGAMVGGLLVRRCLSIPLTARIGERLRAPLPEGEEDACTSPWASPSQDEDKEFIFSPVKRAEVSQPADDRESLLGGYLRQLPGVRSWWEDPRGSLHRVRLGSRSEELKRDA